MWFLSHIISIWDHNCISLIYQLYLQLRLAKPTIAVIIAREVEAVQAFCNIIFGTGLEDIQKFLPEENIAARLFTKFSYKQIFLQEFPICFQCNG